jgi:hypothetical protein
MSEVKVVPMPFPPLGNIPMRMLVVTDEDIANAPACENCMKVRFDHPDMMGERNDWCLDCNDEALKAKGMDDASFGLWVLDNINKGKVIGVIRKDRGSIRVKN